MDNEQKADFLTLELKTTRGCPDDVEGRAIPVARQEIFEVLEELKDLTTVDLGLRERAAGLMGQYAFDRMCALEAVHGIPLNAGGARG